MDGRDPRMITGMTARGIERIAILATLSVVAAAAVFVYGALARPFGENFVADFTLCLAPLCLAGIFWAITSSILSRRQRDELAAGYTTLADCYDQVDQLDARSGEVVRPAHRRTSGAGPAQGAISTGEQLDTVTVAHTPLGLALRSPLFLLVTVAGLASIAAGVLLATDAFVYEIDDELMMAAVLLVLGLTLVTAGPILGLTLLSARAYLGSFIEQFPNARIWLTLSGSDLRDAASELAQMNHETARLRTRMTSVVVVESDRLSFWTREGVRFRPYLLIPRSRVSTATTNLERDFSGHLTRASELTVTKDNGSLVTMSIMMGTGVGGGSPKRSATRPELLVHWRITGDVNVAG